MKGFFWLLPQMLQVVSLFLPLLCLLAPPRDRCIRVYRAATLGGIRGSVAPSFFTGLCWGEAGWGAFLLMLAAASCLLHLFNFEW